MLFKHRYFLWKIVGKIVFTLRCFPWALIWVQNERLIKHEFKFEGGYLIRLFSSLLLPKWIFQKLLLALPELIPIYLAHRKQRN